MISTGNWEQDQHMSGLHTGEKTLSRWCSRQVAARHWRSDRFSFGGSEDFVWRRWWLILDIVCLIKIIWGRLALKAQRRSGLEMLYFSWINTKIDVKERHPQFKSTRTFFQCVLSIVTSSIVTDGCAFFLPQGITDCFGSSCKSAAEFGLHSAYVHAYSFLTTKHIIKLNAVLKQALSKGGKLRT